MLLALLRRMPKPVRRIVGRAWAALDRADALEAVSECPTCGGAVLWNPWVKTLRCASTGVEVYRRGDRTD